MWIGSLWWYNESRLEQEKDELQRRMDQKHLELKGDVKQLMNQVNDLKSSKRYQQN